MTTINLIKSLFFLLITGLSWPCASASLKILGTYPQDSESVPFHNQAAGITTDGKNWYFTSRWHIFKIDLKNNLEVDKKHRYRPIFSDNSLSFLEKWVKVLEKEKNYSHWNSLKSIQTLWDNYNHFGDLDYFQGRLYVSVESKNRGKKCDRVVIFDALSLQFIDSIDLKYKSHPEYGCGSHGKLIKKGICCSRGDTGWVAVNPKNRLLYTSREYPGRTRLIAFKIKESSKKPIRPDNRTKNSQEKSIILYPDCFSYKSPIFLPKGEYPLSSLRRLAKASGVQSDLNDLFSAIFIPQGIIATLFQHHHLNGLKWHYPKPGYQCFPKGKGDIPHNNRISSIKVEPNPYETLILEMIHLPEHDQWLMTKKRRHLELRWTQGGAFSKNGHLYITSSNKPDSSRVFRSGLHGFDVNTGKREVYHYISQSRYCYTHLLSQDYTCYFNLETQGISIYDFNSHDENKSSQNRANSNIPILDKIKTPWRLQGQIHILQLNNDVSPAHDDVHILHLEIKKNKSK